MDSCSLLNLCTATLKMVLGAVPSRPQAQYYKEESLLLYESIWRKPSESKKHHVSTFESGRRRRRKYCALLPEVLHGALREVPLWMRGSPPPPGKCTHNIKL
jgi:hypothetical protein